VPAVTALVTETQPERGVCEFRADLDLAIAEARMRLLIDEPGIEVEVTAAAAALVVPTKLVVAAERQCVVPSGPPGADLTGPLLDPLPGPTGGAVRRNSARSPPRSRCSRQSIS
jgi:hypothetical protein